MYAQVQTSTLTNLLLFFWSYPYKSATDSRSIQAYSLVKVPFNFSFSKVVRVFTASVGLF